MPCSRRSLHGVCRRAGFEPILGQSPHSFHRSPGCNPPVNDRPDPTTRPRTDREVIQARKGLKEELHGSYKQWLEQDVKWIITDDETKAFKSLSNDEERDRFIENFWLRRNPNPDSPENEFREEHYARIAYANEHFAAGKAGWRTDRGHIYIAFGKPDSIDAHPSGGSYDRPIEEGGGNTSTFPFEIWHYRYLEGVGDNIDVEFVDTCQCGDYHNDHRPLGERTRCCTFQARASPRVNRSGAQVRPTVFRAAGSRALGKASAPATTKASSSTGLKPSPSCRARRSSNSRTSKATWCSRRSCPGRPSSSTYAQITSR